MSDQEKCSHIKVETIHWSIAADKKWCDKCKVFVQMKLDWSGHP